MLDPSGGVSAVLRNAASARAYGAEVNITAAVTRNFVVNFSGAFEDSKYKQFDNAPFFIFSPAGNSQIWAFRRRATILIRAPKFVGTAGPPIPFRSQAARRSIFTGMPIIMTASSGIRPSSSASRAIRSRQRVGHLHGAHSGRWYAQLWGAILPIVTTS